MDETFTLEECCSGQIRNFSVAWGPDCQRCPGRKGTHYIHFRNTSEMFCYRLSVVSVIFDVLMFRSMHSS